MSSRPSPRFIALMALLTASTAFGIDMMLTSLPAIAAELSPEQPNHAHYVLTAFFVGVGVGTFVAGPLADGIGRRPVVLLGLGFYALGSVFAALTHDMTLLLVGRFLQGFGAAGPRVAVMAIVRDRFEGRYMAQAVSFITMVFTLVPGVAPLLGDVISRAFGWRAVFWAFGVFALTVGTWFTLQQPETLPRSARRPLALRDIGREARRVLSYRIVLQAIIVLSLALAILIAVLSSSQAVFHQVFDLERAFPYVLGANSVLAGCFSFANARLVIRFGPVTLIQWALRANLALAAALVIAQWWLPPNGASTVIVFSIWMLLPFAVLGLTAGNLTAMALQPLGAIAGTATTVLTASSMLLGGIFAVPISQNFDGTPWPLLYGALLLLALAVAVSETLRPDRDAEEKLAEG
ncbi:MAG: multidrug effflux MFS transporter [Pseudomonadota bacterium]